MKTNARITLFLLSFFVLTFCTVPEEKKGMEQNEFRKAHGGILLTDYLENKTFSTDKEGKNGISLFYIRKEKAQEFRENKTAYIQSKFIHFDSEGIFEEKNILIKVVNDSTEWFVNTIDRYRTKEVDGFIVRMVNGSLLKKTEIQLTRPLRDSILTAWKL